MTTIRLRPPETIILGEPPVYTIEWYGAMGDGVWMLLDRGHMVSTHYWKWQARLARRRWLRRA